MKKIRLKLKVPKSKEECARSYWSKLLHIDSHLFNQSTRPKGRKKSIYQHGTLTVRYHSKKLLEKIGEIAHTLIL